MTDDRTARGLCGPFLEQLSITGASISVFDTEGRQSTICATNSTAARIDELQFELGEGPHWDVIARGTPVLIDDVHGTSLNDYPAFGAALLMLNVGGLFTFPLALGAVAVGVVGLYRSTAGSLSRTELRAARNLSDLATNQAVRHAVTGAEAESPGREPVSAPALRREVHQATGMILAQLDISATEAFIRLRAHAFVTGRPVQDLAHDVVTRMLDFRELP